MKNYDEVIQYFLLEYDNLREQLMKPVLIGDFVYASDGHTAIKIPKDKLSNTYEPNPTYPDIVSLFEKREGIFEKPKIYKPTTIEKLLSEIPEVYISVECQKCEGTGIIPPAIEKKDEDAWDDCDQCHAQGDLFLKEKEYDWMNHRIQINISETENAYFNPNFIERLSIVCDINNVERIEHTVGTHLTANHFMIDGIEIMIMPIRIEAIESDVENSKESTFHKLEEETA